MVVREVYQLGLQLVQGEEQHQVLVQEGVEALGLLQRLRRQSLLGQRDRSGLGPW